MPPKCKFTKEQIIDEALNLVREKGTNAVTARGLGEKLHSSSRPIFSLFKNMDEVQQEVIKAAHNLYQGYLTKEMSEGTYPPYKASGIAYIRFAKEEKELFKLLFMRDRSLEQIKDNNEEVEPLIKIIMQNTGISKEDAYMLHLEMWVYVHGIASMIATSYLEWDWEMISNVLTDSYEGIKSRFIQKVK